MYLRSLVSAPGCRFLVCLVCFHHVKLSFSPERERAVFERIEKGSGVTISLGIPHAALRARNFELPDSLVAMTGSSRKNLRGFDIQSQNEEGRKDDDAYYSFIRIQHGCSRSEALFPSVDSLLDSLEPKFILKEEQRLALHSFITTKKDVLALLPTGFLSLYIRHLV